MLNRNTMAQVENLAFVNSAVEQFGATHVLNVKVKGSGNINNLHNNIKKIINTGQNHS